MALTGLFAVVSTDSAPRGLAGFAVSRHVAGKARGDRMLAAVGLGSRVVTETAVLAVDTA
jgi:hypothetical protein